MPLSFRMIRMANTGALICALTCAQIVSGQTQTPEKPSRRDQREVVRVYTELVQTDVMVFDKQGSFVNGLKREDFELRIDGKPKPIDFFEKVTSGSASEETQLAAARGSTRSGTTQAASSIPLDRGRPIFFYIDDLHLDFRNLKTTQKLITDFIDKEMGQNDEVAIASSSGQIGFLQQLTDNKAVLRSAVERLKLRPYSVRDYETPAMTEYQALLVNNYDRDVTDYFVDQLIANSPGLTRETAEHMVRGRASVLLQQAGNVTANTLVGLEGLVRSADKLPGRKLVFFISDGFFLDDRNGDTSFKLRRITSAAARSGVVIYSLDSRGLVTGFNDASSDSQSDPTGRLLRAAGGELFASQNGLNALARDTGGKAFFNSNALAPSVTRAVKETSTYYLLAWKPEREAKEQNKFRRIEVRIINKPNLTVQVRRGFFDVEPDLPVTNARKEKDKDAAKKSPEVELKKVISSPYPDRGIPVSVRLSYVSTPDRGNLLVAAMQVPTGFLTFAPLNGKESAVVALAGTVYNDKGLPGGGFNKQITISAGSARSGTSNESLLYGYSLSVPPGLYQIRVGARDDKSGRAGSAHAWIEIPNLATGQLAMSSLILSARTQTAVSNASATPDLSNSTELKVAYRFSANDFLRFLVFVYNAVPAPADSKPDAAIQVQVVRDDQPVVTASLKKLSLEGVEDLKRIPYAAEMSLEGLPAGRYLLQVAVVDRVAKRSVSQQTRFEIE
jgi:VWFA-related protein